MTPRRRIVAIATTLMLAALVGFFTAQPGAGFVLWFAVPCLIVWLPYSLYVVIRRPAQRSLQLAKLAIWGVVLCAAVGYQFVMKRWAADAADGVAAKVHAYFDSTGDWPRTLAGAGVDETSVRTWRMRYDYEGGKPALSYPSTFVLFDRYVYDFERREWRLVAG